MNNTIEYKGYTGSVEFSEEDRLFYGKVLGVRSLISYEGEDVDSLLADFHGAVDDYLSVCEMDGQEPERSYTGSFNVRLSPELHRRLDLTAAAKQVSLNSYVEEILEQAMRATA